MNDLNWMYPHGPVTAGLILEVNCDQCLDSQQIGILVNFSRGAYMYGLCGLHDQIG